MKKVIAIGWVALLVVSLAACSGEGSPAEEDTASTEAELSKNTFACTATPATKHPTFADGVSLSLASGRATLTPAGAHKAIALKHAPTSTTKKYKDFDRYTGDVSGKHLVVLVKALADGREAMHLQRPFGGEDYVCEPAAARADGGHGGHGRHAGHDGGRHQVNAGDICEVGGEGVGDCISAACRASEEEEGVSRCQ